ncbi:hypothetical protein QVD17_06777 [Tagetes erecta]|uniref:Uncharacterized protein n=1 Tax=Tagetes erecta TaxID=13708 RepID=A0AAD8PCE7_TARER|nr:hypothetical protein QVD17_06777 [Tagetes erecta]
MSKVCVTSNSTPVETGVELKATTYYKLYNKTELILLLNQTSFAEAVGLCNRIGDEKDVIANLKGLRTMKATLQTAVSPIDIQFKEDEAGEDH